MTRRPSPSFAAALLAAALLALPAAPARAEGAAAAPFAAVDAHALAAGPDAEASLDALAAHLARGARTDVEKARAVFRWIAGRIDYDVKGYFDGTFKAESGDAVLARRSSVCDGYATLFEALGRRLGLEVVAIPGYAKGHGHKRATTFDAPNHAWNAVKIDGRWLWVDSTWGAGFVQDGVYRRRFAPHFFLAEPDRWVLTHLPAKPVAHGDFPPLAKHQFEALPTPEPALAGLRVPGAKLLTTLLRDDFTGFVEAYDTSPELIEIVEVPLQRRLLADVPVSFRLRSGAFEEIDVISGSRWQPFSRGAGGEFEITVPPAARGPLTIAGRRPGEREFMPVLAYEVE